MKHVDALSRAPVVCNYLSSQVIEAAQQSFDEQPDFDSAVKVRTDETGIKKVVRFGHGVMLLL